MTITFVVSAKNFKEGVCWVATHEQNFQRSAIQYNRNLKKFGTKNICPNIFYRSIQKNYLENFQIIIFMIP